MHRRVVGATRIRGRSNGNKNWSHLPHLDISFQSRTEDVLDAVLSGLLDDTHCLHGECGCPFYRETLVRRIDHLKQHETNRNGFYKPDERVSSKVAETTDRTQTRGVANPSTFPGPCHSQFRPAGYCRPSLLSSVSASPASPGVAGHETTVRGI